MALSSRKFIEVDGTRPNRRLLQVRCRMEYLTMCLVRQKGIYAGDKFLGWLLTTTDIPLSQHGKHFLRQSGWPIPGNRNKCNLSVCNARINATV